MPHGGAGIQTLGHLLDFFGDFSFKELTFVFSQHVLFKVDVRSSISYLKVQCPRVGLEV